MPTSPRPRCSQSGCKERAIEKSSYCSIHKKEIQNKIAITRERNPFYSTAEWQRVRLRVLQNEPLCRHCKAKGRVSPATCVDHIIPIANNGKKTDIDNLQPLCNACHNRKTALENSLGR